MMLDNWLSDGYITPDAYPQLSHPISLHPGDVVTINACPIQHTVETCWNACQLFNISTTGYRTMQFREISTLNGMIVNK